MEKDNTKSKQELVQYIANLVKIYEYYDAKGTSDVHNIAFYISNEIDMLTKKLYKPNR